MGGIFSKLFSWLGGPLGARKLTGKPGAPSSGPPLRPPSPPPITAQQRRELAYKNWLDKRQADERLAKARQEHRNQSDPAWRFVHLGEKHAGFKSSNVESYWYEIDAQVLFVSYLDGSLYRYESVTPGEAESLYRSTSKGTWIWDNLRVRGSSLGSRKEYQLVHSGARERKWEGTPAAAHAHAQSVSAQSGAKSPYEKIGKFARDKPLTNKGRRPRRGKI